MNAQRMTLHFSGRVQGVGFRYTAVDVSRRFEVSGQVRNLRDGRVELLAEGRPAELAAFRAAVERAMHGYVAEVLEARAEATGEFRGFRIGR